MQFEFFIENDCSIFLFFSSEISVQKRYLEIDPPLIHL